METKPDYDNTHGPLGKLMDKVFMIVFRNQMASKLGFDSSLAKVCVVCSYSMHGRVNIFIDCVAYSFF